MPLGEVGSPQEKTVPKMRPEGQESHGHTSVELERHSRQRASEKAQAQIGGRAWPFQRIAKVLLY